MSVCQLFSHTCKRVCDQALEWFLLEAANETRSINTHFWSIKNVVKGNILKQKYEGRELAFLPSTEKTHFLSDTLPLCTSVLCIPLTYLDNEKQNCNSPPRQRCNPHVEKRMCKHCCSLQGLGPILTFLRHVFWCHTQAQSGREMYKSTQAEGALQLTLALFTKHTRVRSVEANSLNLPSTKTD